MIRAALLTTLVLLLAGCGGGPARDVACNQDGDVAVRFRVPPAQTDASLRTLTGRLDRISASAPTETDVVSGLRLQPLTDGGYRVYLYPLADDGLVLRVWVGAPARGVCG